MAFNLEPIRANIIFDKKDFAKGLKLGKKTAKGMDKEFKRLNTTIGRVGKAIGALFALSVIKRFLTLGQGIEDIQISLKGLLGSSALANIAFEELTELSKDTKQGLEELAGAFQQLTVEGLGTIENVEALANISTLLSKNTEDVAKAFRSLETETLRNTLGLKNVSTAEGKFSATLRDGNVVLAKTREEFQLNLLAAFKLSDAYKGAARNAAGVFGSSLSTIRTALATLSKETTDVLAPTFDRLARSFADVAKNIGETVKQLATFDTSKAGAVVAALGVSIAVMAGIVPKISSAFINWAIELVGAQATLSKIAGVLGVMAKGAVVIFSKALAIGLLVVGAVKGIAQGLADSIGFSIDWSAAMKSILPILKAIVEGFGSIIEIIAGIFRGVTNLAVFLLKRFKNISEIVGAFILKTFLQITKFAIDSLNKLIEAANKVPGIDIGLFNTEGLESAISKLNDSIASDFKDMEIAGQVLADGLTKSWEQIKEGALGVARVITEGPSAVVGGGFESKAQAGTDKTLQIAKQQAVAALLAANKEAAEQAKKTLELEELRVQFLTESQRLREDILQTEGELILLLNEGLITWERSNEILGEMKEALAEMATNDNVKKLFESFGVSGEAGLGLVKSTEGAISQGIQQGFRSGLESGSVKGFFTEMGRSILDTVLNALVQAFAQAAASQVVSSLLNLLGSLGGAPFGGTGNPKGAAGGTVTPQGQILRMAGGGVVPNFGRPFADSVPALLMPGERVLTRTEAKNADKQEGGTTINFTANVQSMDPSNAADVILGQIDLIEDALIGKFNSNSRFRRETGR